MILLKTRHPVCWLAQVLLLTDFAGYARIRMDCQNFGSRFSVDPRYVSTRESFRAIYRPCFLLEQRFRGNYFTITPWGMVSP